MFKIKLLGLDIYGCHEALSRLDDFIDRELTPDEGRKVRQHLKICHACARKFAFEEELVAGLRDKMQHVALPRDFDSLQARISASLKQEADAPPDNTS